MSEIEPIPEEELADYFAETLEAIAVKKYADFGVRTAMVQDSRTIVNEVTSETQLYRFDATSTFVAEKEGYRMRSWYSLRSRWFAPLQDSYLWELFGIEGASESIKRHLGTIAGQHIVVEWQYEMGDEDDELRTTSSMYVVDSDEADSLQNLDNQPGANFIIDLTKAPPPTREGSYLTENEADVVMDVGVESQALRITEALQGLGYMAEQETVMLHTLQ